MGSSLPCLAALLITGQWAARTPCQRLTRGTVGCLTAAAGESGQARVRRCPIAKQHPGAVLDRALQSLAQHRARRCNAYQQLPKAKMVSPLRQHNSRIE
jgi:hypothetical protein